MYDNCPFKNGNGYGDGRALSIGEVVIEGVRVVGWGMRKRIDDELGDEFQWIQWKKHKVMLGHVYSLISPVTWYKCLMLF